MSGPTTHSREPRRRHGIGATLRRPVELAGQFTTRFPRSPLRAEVVLIETRSAAMAGDHRGAVNLLEPLLKSPADTKGGAADFPR